MSKCIHHFIVTCEAGKTIGRCKKCHKVKVFRDDSEDDINRKGFLNQWSCGDAPDSWLSHPLSVDK